MEQPPDAARGTGGVPRAGLVSRQAVPRPIFRGPGPLSDPAGRNHGTRWNRAGRGGRATGLIRPGCRATVLTRASFPVFRIILASPQR